MLLAGRQITCLGVGDIVHCKTKMSFTGDAVRRVDHVVGTKQRHEMRRRMNPNAFGYAGKGRHENLGHGPGLSEPADRLYLYAVRRRNRSRNCFCASPGASGVSLGTRPAGGAPKKRFASAVEKPAN